MRGFCCHWVLMAEQCLLLLAPSTLEVHVHKTYCENKILKALFTRRNSDRLLHGCIGILPSHQI